MTQRRILVFAFFLLCGLTSADAQERPFLFTLTPSGTELHPLVLQYDAAYGKNTFEPIGGNNVEQTLGLQTQLGPAVTLLGKVGFATAGTSTITSQHVELLVRMTEPEGTSFRFSAGPGVRHEYSGTTVLLGRVVAGVRTDRWQAYGNMLIEKPFARDRDAVDLLFTAGWSYNISSTMLLGVEAVGQDLEGFWEPDEAEGGATLFLGPTFSMQLPESSSTLTIGVGPILRATQSGRSSSALRNYPVAQGNGFVLHAAVNYGI